ncbi:hypothetical protein DPEC_G00026170 [Dallia pectoralis]|uniref:Uncharacterized protein n=1 Tax=Dallia pectoralis TaxID=75939 RepID=A0ACC2HIY9_DALPE|nr:hypothetical protein DPEC_G00026170 [Dallia pectoralis]
MDGTHEVDGTPPHCFVYRTKSRRNPAESTFARGGAFYRTMHTALFESTNLVHEHGRALIARFTLEGYFHYVEQLGVGSASRRSKSTLPYSVTSPENNAMFKTAGVLRVEPGATS